MSDFDFTTLAGLREWAQAQPRDFFFYVATPYSAHPRGRDEAFEEACVVAARLLDAELPIFCPIAHSHPICGYTKHPAQHTHAFWMAVDRPLIYAAGALLVIMLDGWMHSVGVQEEIDRFRERGRLVIFVNPETWEINR